MAIGTNYSNTWGPTIQETPESSDLERVIENPVILNGNNSLARNEELLLQAIEKNAEAYKYASIFLKYNPRFQEEALRVNSGVREYIFDYPQKINLQLACAKAHGNIAIEDLEGPIDESVLVAAAKTQKLIDRITLDRIIANPETIIGNSLARNEEFMLQVIEENPRAFIYASVFFKHNPRFQEEAIHVNGAVREYIVDHSEMKL